MCHVWQIVFYFCPVTLPKPKMNPAKMEQAGTCGADLHRHQGRLPHAHRHPAPLVLLRRVAAAPISSIVTQRCR
nr:hypothetical protein CFP56_65767 [Quercus suber]